MDERERWRLTDDILRRMEEAHKQRCQLCRCEPPWHYAWCPKAEQSAEHEA